MGAELSILVPTHDDGAALAKAFRELDAVVNQASMFVEVLVVDQDSADDTVAVATDLAAEYPNLHVRVFRHGGDSFGGLIRFAVAHASGRYCAVVSGDGSDPVSLLPAMLKELRAGAPLVICSRYARRGDDQNIGLSYRLYQRVYRSAIRALLGHRVTDSTYGFRGFNRTYVQSLGLSSNRFNIFPEMTLKVLLSGGTVQSLAGSPQPVGASGAEKFKLPSEILGYAYVLSRATLHRSGLRWF